MKKNKVSILGTTYQIRPYTYGEMFDKMNYAVNGFIDYKEKIIGYSTAVPSNIKPVLLHEYIHGLFYEGGFTVDNEENLIEFLVRHMDKLISFSNSISVKVIEDEVE